MNEFTFLYRGGSMEKSPEEMQKTYQKWTAWFNELTKKGALKNIGHPLEDEGSVVTGKSKLVSDGPFAEAKDVVGGFSIVAAESLAAAAELAKGCPILEKGGSVEVRPIMAMSM